MDKDSRNAIERATQRARKLLEEDFATQLEGDFDVQRTGALAPKAGPHLTRRQAFLRERVIAAIDHKLAAGMKPVEAVADYLRDAAFTTLNRFVALKMLEARDLVQECVTKGEHSSGYREFYGLAAGVALLPQSAGYRLYIESLFDELSTEVKVLFDRRDPSSVLWPKRANFEGLLGILNASELAGVWGEDETIGWVYQFFNGQDERRKMRDESATPRNGRELAVRNQFFTPRYVVQFLTDNTLGRIWYEMRGTETVLAERCEYMINEPDETFAPRSKKDPRDLRVLDPACGSGHFLLYAFDLLLTIYEESYADHKSPKSEVTSTALAEDYPSLDALRKAAPGLILAHNLHGVDIDPRCAQIAQLALWMRAQKAYRDFGVGRAERPQIRRSNIVVAEPLVADEQIAKEFVAKLGDAELERVFTSLVESLNIAGDMGLLLRVEQLVTRQAKRGQSSDLFAPPEERIRAALARFVGDEGSRANTRRRLFADDAAHGVALLGVAEKKFDAVLMNPPFGAGSIRAKKEFEKAYPRTKNDLYGAFVERGIELLASRGRVGAITSRTGFFLSSFQKWREEVLLSIAPPIAVLDLGYGVMDSAMVEAAAYCVEKDASADSCVTWFIRLTSADDKVGSLRDQLVRIARGEASDDCFHIPINSLRTIPGSPFAYWVSDGVRRLFGKFERFEREGRTAKQGLTTADDFRFVRAWWEVKENGLSTRWFPFLKGGEYRPFYADISLVVLWTNDGREMKAWADPLYDNSGWSRIIKSTDLYFRAGLTWPLRAVGLAMTPVPRGCIFSARGYLATGPEQELLPMLGLMNSGVFEGLFRVGLSGERPEFIVGILNALPFPSLGEAAAPLAEQAKQAWSAMRSLDTGTEVSHAFLLPPSMQEKATADGRRISWSTRVQDAARISARVRIELDRTCTELYELSDRDAATLLHGVAGQAVLPSEAGALDRSEGDSESPEEVEMDDGAVRAMDAALSWAVGVSFRRFDARLATGERALPPEPEPFDALRTRSPGMYPEGGEPADHPEILVDDEGHVDDLAARARALAESVHVDVPENLRDWLAKEFFPLHVKMYSKSRRKAPIYWQLATASASYSVWLYIHALTPDTLYTVQRDYLAPKVAHEERKLDELRSQLGASPGAADRKKLAAQEAFVDELRAFLAEIKLVTPLWTPELDDGVVINAAPLWRLFPHHKTWQKELAAVWKALVAEEYDWSHMALHLWPERVVPKCADDRSLAIAHGLAEVFWVEDAGGKWKKRGTPTTPVRELVKARTSAAVKDALRALMEAPQSAGTGRAAGKRAARASKGDRS